MTHSELMNRVSARELIQWEIFATREPLPAERLDLNIARLIHVLVALNTDKKHSRKRTWADYIVNWWPSKKKSEDDVILDLITATIQMGGDVSPEVLEEYGYDIRHL